MELHWLPDPMIRLCNINSARGQGHTTHLVARSISTRYQRCLRLKAQALRKHNLINCFLRTKLVPRSDQQAVNRTYSRNVPVTRRTFLASYESPKSGVLSLLPRSVIPYAELIRLDKPTGTYYLYFPCLFSTLLAATMAEPPASPLAVTGTSLLFFAGALIMRGAGCTINDLWDRKLDPYVRRTRLRPIARGAISPKSALLYTMAQLLVGLGILVQFPQSCFWYGIPSLLLVAMYPLAKRITYYPQFVLGLTFSWGAIMGFPALGIDLLSNHDAFMAAIYLYSSNIAWVVLYDTIYAHMDVKDDQKAGIKSIAVKHERNTKWVMAGLAGLQTILLAAAGSAAGVGPIFYFCSCGSALATLGSMTYRVNLQSESNCWWWFRYGCLLTGGGISVGLLGEYLARISGSFDEAFLKGNDVVAIPS